jgi:hypothetical protein
MTNQHMTWLLSGAVLVGVVALVYVVNFGPEQFRQPVSVLVLVALIVLAIATRMSPSLRTADKLHMSRHRDNMDRRVTLPRGGVPMRALWWTLVAVAALLVVMPFLTN